MMYSIIQPIFYLPSYLYIIDYIVFIICLLFILLGLVYLLSTRVMVKDAEKLSSYECGFQAFGDTRATFDVQFYLVAIIFLIFDIEVAFIVPWAIMLRYMDFIGLVLMYFFLFILTVGFIYEWKSGVLSWRNTALQNIIENPKSNNWFKEYHGFIFLNLSTFTDVNIYVTSFSNYFQSSIFIWIFITLLVCYLLHIAFKNLNLFKIHLNDLIIIFLSIIIVELLLNLNVSNEINIILFNDLLISDAFTDLFLLVLNITAFLLITSINFVDDLFSEYEFVIVFALYLVFLNFMISSINLLTIYLTIEGSSFCLFILISYTTTQWSAIEAAIKYFVQSAVVGVIFALGQAFLYGIIPSLNLYDIAFIVSNNLEVPKSLTNFYMESLNFGSVNLDPILSIFETQYFDINYTIIIKDYLVFSFIKSNFFFYLSCILILSALFFKLSVFPFYFWTADVYDGAPTTVTALMALLNKIAIFAVFIRFVVMICYIPELHNNSFSNEMTNLLSVVEWNPFKFIFKISVLGSVILGGFAVLRQKSLKRFAAYSTINNIGFILIGFFALFNFNDNIQNGLFQINSLFIFECITSMLVYFFIYNFTNLAFFLILSTSFVKNVYLNKYSSLYFMSDLVSLYRKNKLVSLFMVIIMFIFSGLPPFVTFYSKIMILRLLMNTLSFSEEIFLFLFIILLCTVITSYFYIRIARTIFAEVENTSNQKIIYTNLDASTIIFYIFGLLLLMPFLPTLINYCFFASQALVLFN